MALSNKTPIKIASAVDLTQTPAYNSPSLITLWLNQGAIQINVSSVSSNNGVFKLQGSLDGINWADLCLPNTQTPIAATTLAGTAITILYQLSSLSCSYVRVVFTRGSSHTDGVADIWFSGKEI